MSTPSLVLLEHLTSFPFSILPAFFFKLEQRLWSAWISVSESACENAFHGSKSVLKVCSVQPSSSSFYYKLAGKQTLQKITLAFVRGNGWKSEKEHTK
jgi:hypothetical protein